MPFTESCFGEAQKSALEMKAKISSNLTSRHTKKISNLLDESSKCKTDPWTTAARLPDMSVLEVDSNWVTDNGEEEEDEDEEDEDEEDEDEEDEEDEDEEEESNEEEGDAEEDDEEKDDEECDNEELQINFQIHLPY
ncbi:hypothetical protein [Parasitella parasitica]|uniref:Uncharacterized protein n=1 Tax=Parasitella parasitica TaxID=35722 RepID=A0A0B7MVM0_9FUNG|nr:hypothetical protein [Parasitella parasitica]